MDTNETTAPATPTRATFKGHGRPAAGTYFGHGPDARTEGQQVTLELVRTGVRVLDMDGNKAVWMDLSPSAKFWFIPA